MRCSALIALTVGACAGSAPASKPPPAAPASAPERAPSTPSVPASTADPGGPRPPSLPPLPAASPDRAGCTLEGPLAPLLAPVQEGSPVTVRQEPGLTVESLTLPPGTPVRVVQGGCAHYGVALAFSVVDAPADPLAAARQLLARLVPARGELPVQGGLRQAPDPVPEEGYACGDAWCTVSVEPVPGGFVVEAGYSFPL